MRAGGSMLLAPSGIPEIAWPPLPGAAASAMLAMQFQFTQSERLSPAALAAHQWSQVQRLLDHARATVPFWAARLDAAGLAGDVPDPEAFARLPVLTRAEVQAAGAALRSKALPGSHGQARPGSTSGSTGTPVQFWSSDLARFFFQACSLRDHLWHGRDFAATQLAIRNEPAATAASWYPGADGAAMFRTGPSVVVPLTGSLESQAERLLALRPAYLTTHATQLAALARHWLDQGLPHPGLVEARSFAEALAPETRALVRQAWQVAVTDVYTTQECGYLALQCPASDAYHVQSEVCLVEVLDGDGRPCGPGETGRVVVTPLHNFAMPLLRYELGDLAEVSGPCACGRGLPTLAAVHGRVRDMVRLPDGSRRWPLIGFAFRDLPGVRQVQLAQVGPAALEVRLVAQRPLDAAQQAQVRAGAAQRLGYPFEVRFVYLDAIARGPGGKFHEFRSEWSGD